MWSTPLCGHAKSSACMTFSTLWGLPHFMCLHVPCSHSIKDTLIHLGKLDFNTNTTQTPKTYKKLKGKSTTAGFEPARSKPKRFLIFLLNHSDKLPVTMCVRYNLVYLLWKNEKSWATRKSPWVNWFSG